MPSRSEAFFFLENVWAPQQTVHGPMNTMLYVGVRQDMSPWWYTTFHERLGKPKISVLEINPDNIKNCTDMIPDCQEWICGDVREIDIFNYDLVMWDEGPEHVSKEDALTTLDKLALRNGLVLISCPWGFQPQGSSPADHEFHHWGPMPEDFATIGFKTEVFGDMFNGSGGGHGNLIGWR